ncbi:MAG: SNARE associated Golgi protein, partial [Rhodospirillales bacterium]
MNFRVLVRGLVLILTLAGIVLLLKSTQLGASLDKSWVDTTIRGHGIYGELIFLGVAAVFTGLGLPRQVVSFLGGYAFGLVLGSAL